MKRYCLSVILCLLLPLWLFMPDAQAKPAHPSTPVVKHSRVLTGRQGRKSAGKLPARKRSEPYYLAKMPKGAYLRRPAPTAVALVRQVHADGIVQQRYVKAWGVSVPMVLNRFQGVRLTKMAQPTVMKVYYFRPATGVWGYRLRTVGKGCPVFVHPDGKPFLVQVCGNPILPIDKRVATLAKSEATTIKEFDPEESLATDLVVEPPVPAEANDTSVAPADPGSVAVAENGTSTSARASLPGGGANGSGSSSGGGYSGGSGSGVPYIGGGGGSASSAPGISGRTGSGASASLESGSSLAESTPSGGRTREVKGSGESEAAGFTGNNGGSGGGAVGSTGGSTGGDSATDSGSTGGVATTGGSTGGSLSTPEPSVALTLPVFLLLSGMIPYCRRQRRLQGHGGDSGAIVP